MLGLRTVSYKVDNLAAAKAWYSQAFGVEPYFDEPFYVGFNIGGYELGLQPEEAVASIKGDNSVVYWGVEDIAAEFSRLLALGATAHETPQDVGAGIIVASVRDPWQNILGIIYNPHFSLD